MSTVRTINIDYLTEDEIVQFYELFFGKILVKKPDFSYKSNLANYLANKNLVESALAKLKTQELEILKLLSIKTTIPYDFIAEKLTIILSIPSTNVNKALTSLLSKKYIFLRDEKTLVIPHIYFSDEEDKKNKIMETTLFKKIEYPIKKFETDMLVEINNVVNYLITKELKFSNSRTLYKKDLILIEEVFQDYSLLKKEEFNLIAYFFSSAFVIDETKIDFEKIKDFFQLTSLEKNLYFLKFTFPSFYAIVMNFYKLQQTIQMSLKEFKRLWTITFLLTEYDFQPIKFNFTKTIAFLDQLTIIKVDTDKKNIVIPHYLDEYKQTKDSLKLSSNFNFYMNSNSNSEDFYVPSLFANFNKYDRIVEYEISESSIKRGIVQGLTLDIIFDYFTKSKVKFSKNVETTIKHWFERFGSYFYVEGVVFVCETKEKGQVINQLIDEGVIKAYEIRENEIFLVKEEDRFKFFDFLKKSGINFYHNEPLQVQKTKEYKYLNLDEYLKDADEQSVEEVGSEVNKDDEDNEYIENNEEKSNEYDEE